MINKGGKHDSSRFYIRFRIDSGNVRGGVFSLAEPGRVLYFLLDASFGVAG
jgi:hypothetical protein